MRRAHGSVTQPDSGEGGCMKECPKVSIVVPVYNGANYMREAIYSAISQTYPNVEVIVVNDGSSDGGATEEIALSYGHRIRYIAQKNGGVATALNAGIEHMTGTYFAWLSHDDVYALDKIERQMEIISTVPADTILYGGYELIDSRSQGFGHVDPGELYPEEKLNLPLFPLLRGLINGCTLLIHKSHFDRVGTFDPKLRSTQDYDLWYRMFRDSRVKYHRGLYVKSRSHAEQGTHSMPRHEEECSVLWNYMMDHLTEGEMVAMDGSVIGFRRKTVQFLRANTTYRTAIDHATQLYKEEIGRVEAGIDDILVSVVIPFYNRVDLVSESVESALLQSHKRVEVILVDDGSDEDVDRIGSIVERDKRIRYFRQEHKGSSAARNMGIDVAMGEYIAFLDSDDLYERDKIELQLSYMVERGCEFAHTSYQRMNMAGDRQDVVDSGRVSGEVLPRIIAGCAIATPTVMISRRGLGSLRFNEEFEFGEDVCLWIDLAARYELGALSEALTLVRVSGSSAAFDAEKQAVGLANIVAHVMRNPRYRSYAAEISVIVAALLERIGQSTPGYANAQAAPAVGSGVRPYGMVRRVLVSLVVDGVDATIKKVVGKVRGKWRLLTHR